MRIKSAFVIVVTTTFFVELIGFSTKLSAQSEIINSKIEYITTVRQFGPVAYRAPL